MLVKEKTPYYLICLENKKKPKISIKKTNNGKKAIKKVVKNNLLMDYIFTTFLIMIDSKNP